MNSRNLAGELSRRLGYTNKDAAVLVASLVEYYGSGIAGKQCPDISGIRNL